MDGGSAQLSDVEMTKLDAWLVARGLNKYGDPQDTMYIGGNPCFDMTTGEMKDRYVYLVAKFPLRPWNA